jgi:hypothetical protein
LWKSALPLWTTPNVSIDSTAKWLVDRLEVKGQGVVECDGGSIEPETPAPTGRIALGTSAPGVARLLVQGGGRVETTGELVIGDHGDGQLTVDASSNPTNVVVGGALRAGLQPIDLGNVTLRSDITTQGENLIAAALEYLGGDFELGHAALAHVTGDATIGRALGPGGARSARVSLLGNGPPSVTRLQLDGTTKIAETGRVEIRNATLLGSAIDIDPGGALIGSGADNVVSALNGILNDGRLEGRLRLAAGTNILSQSTGTVELVQRGSGGTPQLSPLAPPRSRGRSGTPPLRLRLPTGGSSSRATGRSPAASWSASRTASRRTRATPSSW